MEAQGMAMMNGSSNVVFMSSILGHDGTIPGHKCDWECQNEHVWGNMYRCRSTGVTHICDKNCNQKILYDDHSSVCRVSRQVFAFTPVEQQAVRGIRRKFEAEACPSESCSFKRPRSAAIHPSPFERSFSAASPICSLFGDGIPRFNHLWCCMKVLQASCSALKLGLWEPVLSSSFFDID